MYGGGRGLAYLASVPRTYVPECGGGIWTYVVGHSLTGEKLDGEDGRLCGNLWLPPASRLFRHGFLRRVGPLAVCLSVSAFGHDGIHSSSRLEHGPCSGFWCAPASVKWVREIGLAECDTLKGWPAWKDPAGGRGGRPSRCFLMERTDMSGSRGRLW